MTQVAKAQKKRKKKLQKFQEKLAVTNQPANLVEEQEEQISNKNKNIFEALALPFEPISRREPQCIDQFKHEQHEQEEKDETELNEAEIFSLSTNLQVILTNPEILASPKFKNIRRQLFQCMEILDFQKFSKIQTQVGHALKQERFLDALYLLEKMGQPEKSALKLGSIQRWVRDIDAAAESQKSPLPIRVLDAILRIADPESIGCADKQTEQHIRKQADFYSLGPFNETQHLEQNQEVQPQQAQQGREIAQNFKILYREKGAERRPPNHHDMILYVSKGPNGYITPTLASERATVFKIDIPTLPHVSIIRNVLSRQECTELINTAEAIGFTPDEPIASSAQNSILAHNVFLMADAPLLKLIWERVVSLLPHQIEGGDVAGLNCRMRVYRYKPGQIYRPHLDGAWPGSGIDPLTQEYQYDAFKDRSSKLTFLIRLNDCFKGGATTFFTPSNTRGIMDSTSVYPAQGDVLCFRHGSVSGTLLHEGSGVLETKKGGVADTKYVIRTEVLYKTRSVSKND